MNDIVRTSHEIRSANTAPSPSDLAARADYLGKKALKGFAMGARKKKELCCCGGTVRRSIFDLALNGAGSDDERLYFGIAGALCLACGSLSLDRDTRMVLGIDPGTTMSLIESDAVLPRDLAA